MGGDQRQFERFATKAPADVIEFDDDHAPRVLRGCVVSDLSRGGVCVTASTPIYVGRSMIISLRTGDIRRVFTGVARHATYKKGSYLIGVEFCPLAHVRDVEGTMKELGINPSALAEQEHR